MFDLFDLKRLSYFLLPEIFPDPSFPFLDLPRDLQKFIFQILLLDPSYYHATTFLNLSFSCKTLFSLGLLVLSEEIYKENFLHYFALPNSAENFIDLFTSHNRLCNKQKKPLFSVEERYGIKESYIIKKLSQQINNESGFFSFRNSEKKYSLRSTFDGAEIEGFFKNHFYSAGAKYTRYYQAKPPVFETFCIKQAIKENNVFDVPHRAFFFTSAYMPYHYMSKFKSSQSNGFFKQASTKALADYPDHRHKNPDNQYQYDQRFGLTII